MTRAQERADGRFRCKRCEYRWRPRVTTTPKKCPSCGSPYWNKKRTRAATVAAIARPEPKIFQNQNQKIAVLKVEALITDADALLEYGKKKFPTNVMSSDPDGQLLEVLFELVQRGLEHCGYVEWLEGTADWKAQPPAAARPEAPKGDAVQ